MKLQDTVILLDSLVLYCSLTSDKILKSICTLNIFNDFENSNFKNKVNYVKLVLLFIKCRYCIVIIEWFTENVETTGNARDSLYLDAEG